MCQILALSQEQAAAIGCGINRGVFGGIPIASPRLLVNIPAGWVSESVIDSEGWSVSALRPVSPAATRLVLEAKAHYAQNLGACRFQAMLLSRHSNDATPQTFKHALKVLNEVESKPFLKAGFTRGKSQSLKDWQKKSKMKSIAALRGVELARVFDLVSKVLRG